MDWQAIGAIGEVGGAVGVVATLVYLAVQIRQNSAVTRAQTRAQISLYSDRIIEGYLSNQPLAEIAQKVRDGEALTATETFVRSMLIRRIFRNAEHSYYQYRVGTYDTAEFQGERVTFARTLTSPEYTAWWDQNKWEFSAVFQREVEALLDESSVGSP